MVHELFAYLCVNDAVAAIDYYARSFGAREKFRLVEPGGRIGHAELEIGGTTLMLSEEFPEYGIRGPLAIGGSPVTLHIHVDDADATTARAVEAGGKLEMPATDMFYGERSGVIRDPFGHRWNIGHSIEKLEPEEMQRRYTAMMGG
jgi:uncharacterized glyoxalase superfamily protein PhnB